MDRNKLCSILEPWSTQARMRFLDCMYGPRAAQGRADIVSELTGDKVPKSDKRVQWGNFRRLVLDLAGIPGNCIALEDAELHKMIADYRAEMSGAASL